MRAVDLLMPRAAVLHAGPHKSSQAVGRVVPIAVTVVDIASAKRARCIPLPVQVAETRRRYLSSRGTTDQYIAATATGRKAPPIEVIIAGRAGKPHK